MNGVVGAGSDFKGEAASGGDHWSSVAGPPPPVSLHSAPLSPLHRRPTLLAVYVNNAFIDDRHPPPVVNIARNMTGLTKKMRLLNLWCAFCAIANVGASVGEEYFKKCCLKNQSLVKETIFDLVSSERYECVDSESAKNNYNLSSVRHLIIAEDVSIDYGIPQNCDLKQTVQLAEDEIKSTILSDCYDRLLFENINGTLKIIPKTVALSCIFNETDNNLATQFKIDHFRKCCPEGQGYDTEHHRCRNIVGDNSEEWLFDRLNIKSNYIYELEDGLACKNDQFSIELTEDLFSLEVDGSTLNVLGNNGGGRLRHGEWCVDRDFSGPRVVARVCTANCSQFGSYCFRKCCPIGQHYKPFRCGSLKSVCVPSTDEGILLDLSSYLEPLKNDYEDLLDVLGIKVGLQCHPSKFTLNNSVDHDRHWLTRDGLLMGKGFDPKEYCLEAFDQRNCQNNDDVIVTAVVCFVPAVLDKNFLMAAVANSISAVCLLLTLAVYCSLPELRNLHGRTVICHVSTMLFAYSCLARAQYSKVQGILFCTLLGYGIYFGFVGAFFWLNVMCFDIWWTFGSIRTVQSFRKSGAETRRFAWYSLYAWGVTLLLTLIMYLLDAYAVSDIFDAEIGKSSCWFGSDQNSETDWPHYIFFVVPLGVVTSVNLVLWALTARHCARIKSEVHRLQAGSVGDRAKKRFRLDRAKYILTGKLWVVMGAGWFSELLSTLFEQPPWLWAIIDLINELQGLFIFLILVFKPKVYHLIRKRLGCSRTPIDTRLEKPDPQKNGTASSGRTSSTFLSRTISSDERTNLRISIPNDVKRA